MNYQEEILELLNHGVNFFPLIHKKLNISKKETQAVLDNMVGDGSIVFDKYENGYFPLKLATLDIKESGYAFGIVEGEDDDYFIPAEYITNAYDNDKALIYPFTKGRRLLNAKIYKIVERAHKYVIGTLKDSIRKKGPRYYIVSNMHSFPVKVIVKPENLNNAKVGTIVYAEITYVGADIFGVITETLGYKDDPGIDISEIALEYGFKTPFPEEVMEQLETIKDEVMPSELVGRRDFTDRTVITIDGDDSKDFDDAVYAKKLGNGNYQLEVYIADVSHYVDDFSPLDKEAFARGTSVYLADRVIPMLPRKLSNGICSLNEGVIRLVLACLMEIDQKGNLVNYEIVEGYIKSSHRMTYNKVNKILNGEKELMEEYQDITPMVYEMLELSHIIRERRYKKGGIEFEVDEYHIDLNDDGSPKEINLRTRDEAEKLIEDFMLQANETIAYHMNIMNLPCVYRVHEKPDQEKLHNVFDMISNMGVKLKNTQNDIHPKQIQDALEKITDSHYQPIINNLLLRSMMKARYLEKCLGHYGLAMQYYCHFTSPIRRYPDLMTHRLIKKLLLHPVDLESGIKHYEEMLPEICLKNSASERKSIECERAVNDMLYAWYMMRHIYQTYTGIITSITSFGMFVTLENGIEGLISYSHMNGFFDYDAKLMIATNSQICYHLGDKVEIVVIASDKETRKIDFMLKDDYLRKSDDHESNLY